jgi:hypothetical protein
MDTSKVEADSDSDCQQLCSQSDGYFDTLKEERQHMPEVASDAKVGVCLFGCLPNL